MAVDSSNLQQPLIQSDGFSRTEIRSKSLVPEDVLAEEGNFFFNNYYKFVAKFHRSIVVFWVVIFCISGYYAPTFMTLSVDALAAPEGTRAFADQVEFESLFPEKAQAVPVLMLMESLQGKDVSEDMDLKAFTFSITNDILERNKTAGNVIGYMSYYLYDGTLLDDVKKPFLSENKHSTFMTVFVNITATSDERKSFVEWLDDVIDAKNPDPSKYDIGLTGMDQLAASVIGTSQEQMKRTDSFSIPVAMLLLGYMVSSWRLLLLGLFNMSLTIVTGFAVMVFLVETVNVGHPDSTCAQLMQGLSLSLSIDYTLFICSRFKEELDALKGSDKYDTSKCDTKSIALCRAMLYAGHVVLMSGITIVVVFFGFTMLPAEQVRVDGIGCAIGVLITMAISFSNVPALIMTFPQFFTVFCCDDSSPRRSTSSLCCWPSCLGRGGNIQNSPDSYASLYERAEVMDRESYDNDDNVSFQGDSYEDDGKPHPMYRTMRFKITRWVTKWPNNVITILLLYVCVVPLALQAARININEDILSALPRGSEVSDRLEAITEEFSAGLFSPYSIVAVPDAGNVMTKEVFDRVATVSERILRETSCKVDPNSVVSPAFMRGKRISFVEAEILLMAAKNWPCTEKNVPQWDHMECSVAKEYEYLFQQSVNEERSAMIIEVTVPFFPFAKESQPFIDTVYDIIDDENGKTKKSVELSYSRDWTGLYYCNQDTMETTELKNGVRFLFCGNEVGYDAIMRKVYGLFPLMTALTLGSVFLVLSFMLRSLFAPVRLALTLFLPLLAVYGAGVIVYQDGALQSVSSCFTKTGGFYWFIPILITSIVCGLALDYDVFLLTRIIEHRSAGYDIRASITKATCETGGTIASAGIIMTLAFGGMLFANQATMNLSGFILGLAVLLDTFVVNTLLVPALMSLGDRIAWYPVRMPMENLITLESTEFVGMEAYSRLDEPRDEGESATSGSQSVNGTTMTSVSTNDHVG